MGNRLRGSVEQYDYTDRYVTHEYRQMGLNYANSGFFNELMIERPSGALRDAKMANGVESEDDDIEVILYLRTNRVDIRSARKSLKDDDIRRYFKRKNKRGRGYLSKCDVFLTNTNRDLRVAVAKECLSEGCAANKLLGNQNILQYQYVSDRELETRAVEQAIAYKAGRAAGSSEQSAREVRARRTKFTVTARHNPAYEACLDEV